MANFVAVLGNGDSLTAAEASREWDARTQLLQSVALAEDSSFPVEILSQSSGSGLAWEELEAFRRRSMDREAPKLSKLQRENTTVMCYSRLKRTMADNSVLQSMGFGQDVSDPNAPPPTDSHLVMGYFAKMMAKQRWSKAGNAISALRALKLAGGGLAPPPDAPAADEGAIAAPSGVPARRGRISITALAKPDAGTTQAKKATLGKLAPPRDVADFVKNLKGSYAFVVMDTDKEFVLAARSADGAVPLLWGLGMKGEISFSSSSRCFPEGAAVEDFPAGYFFMGRCAEPPVAYATETLEAHPALRLPSEPASFCRADLGADETVAPPITV